MEFIDIPFIYYDEMARFIKSKGYKTDGIRRCPTEVCNFDNYIELMWKYLDNWQILPTFINTNMPKEELIKFRDEFLEKMFKETKEEN